MTPADHRAQSAHAFQLSLLLEGHLAEMELYARLLFQTSQDLPVNVPGADAIHALHGAMRDRIACCWADYERLENLPKQETAA